MLLALPRMGDLSPDEESAHSRLEHWGYGMEQFKQHPLFGIGYEMFTENYSHTAHNSFVLIFTEAGVVGATLWIALFFCTFRDLRLLRLEWRGPPYMDNVVDSLVGALLSWQVSAFFLSQTYKPLSFILMGLVVAVQTALAKDGIVLTRVWGLREYGQSLMLTIGGIIFVHIMLIGLWAF
jgi:putative inorganic carbon (hco3(-)) transporter